MNKILLQSWSDASCCCRDRSGIHVVLGQQNKISWELTISAKAKKNNTKTKNKTYCIVITSQDVHMRTLKDRIPQLPYIIPVPLFLIHPTWSGSSSSSKIFCPCLIASVMLLMLKPSCNISVPREVCDAETIRLCKMADSCLGASVSSLKAELCGGTEVKSFGDPLGVEGRCNCEEDLCILVLSRCGRLNLLDFCQMVIAGTTQNKSIRNIPLLKKRRETGVICKNIIWKCTWMGACPMCLQKWFQRGSTCLCACFHQYSSSNTPATGSRCLKNPMLHSSPSCCPPVPFLSPWYPCLGYHVQSEIGRYLDE